MQDISTGKVAKSGGRYSALDGWRGIAALFVAIFHFQVASHLYFAPFTRQAYLLVDFFFVLSGFVIAHAYCNRLHDKGEFVTFVIRRFGRIWPMHMVVLAAFIVAETAIFIAQSHIGGALPRPPFSADRTLAAIPANLLLLNGTGIYEHSTWNGPSWSVSAELWINVLFGLCAITAGRRHMALAMAMLAAGSAIILILFCPTYLDTDGAYALFRCGYGFFIGYFVWRAVQARKGSTPRPVLDSLIEIALVISAVTFISYAQVGPWQMPIPLFFAIFVYLFARQAGLVSRLLESRPIQKLGHLSYAIYIIHFFFAFALNNVIRVGGKIAHVPSVLPGTQLALVGNAYVMDGITIAYLAIVITTAHFANRWIETPAMLWFNRQSVWLAEKRQGLPPASAS
ncbi:acyltransferase family protein [Novosphingobium pokkalii]|uniref:Acyltransferase family protein n=1 Tax=Novosphingobium pokkalii TaxID=1770194 RepID=A0ABV7V4M6_9SPHN|nr:acyltransferase [Novosphingobium pokkalii]GHC91763.1 acyltransferase [Novosphingobium pokkalii]